jgi:hypothetical protein
MSEELMKREQQQQLDGFAGYDDRVEGETEQVQRGVIQGSILKFTNNSTWVTRDGAELAANLELVAVDVKRVVQKWKDQQPVETRVLEPGQKFPDLEKLNEKTPQSEWEMDRNGQPRGPWQAQHVVYLLNPETMDKYSFPTGTVGGSIATRELVDKTLWMRRYRGAHVYPIVVLSDVFMNTHFGGRQRPHFIIKRWISFDGGRQVLPATLSLPPTTVKDALDTYASNPAPTQPKTAAPPTQPKTVSEPSLAEEMNDSIPL